MESNEKSNVIGCMIVLAMAAGLAGLCFAVCAWVWNNPWVWPLIINGILGLFIVMLLLGLVFSRRPDEISEEAIERAGRR